MPSLGYAKRIQMIMITELPETSQIVRQTRFADHEAVQYVFVAWSKTLQVSSDQVKNKTMTELLYHGVKYFLKLRNYQHRIDENGYREVLQTASRGEMVESFMNVQRCLQALQNIQAQNTETSKISLSSVSRVPIIETDVSKGLYEVAKRRPGRRFQTRVDHFSKLFQNENRLQPEELTRLAHMDDYRFVASWPAISKSALN